MKTKIKKKIVIFLSADTLSALNKKAEIEEQSRSSVVSSIIRESLKNLSNEA